MQNRRNFIKGLGLGVTPAFLPKVGVWSEKEKYPAYNYTQPRTLSEAVSREDQIILRIEFTSKHIFEKKIAPKIQIENGNIFRSKNYFFEPGDVEYFEETGESNLALSENDTDILVLWLDDFSENTTIKIREMSKAFSFQLGDIITGLEVKGVLDNCAVKANFLLDKEIGEINPADVGILDKGKDFTFLIMADPQGGDTSNPKDNRCRMKIHNAFIEESIKLSNRLKVEPSFCLMLGDIVDHQGEARDFAQMKKFFDELEVPVLYEMGNHESRYQTAFEPGYNLSGFNNYFAAQKEINGMEKLLYSFNLGEWHFIIWPDPLRRKFWENHPHYFDWLENDLEKYKDRPTLFFQHVPMQPIGINPLVNYTESAYVKSLLFSILAKHGNVKNIYSGHVHIPVKSSFKTALEIEGINCINLPAAGYRPRSFGEQDYYGGPAQGLCVVDVKGAQVKTTYKTVTTEEFTYPEKLPAFDTEKFPLWLSNKWNLPAEKQFVNGKFIKDLEGWGRRYIYEEDVRPSNICKTTILDDGSTALYLKTEKRGFAKPGQDRLPQGLNRAFQAVKLNSGKPPSLNFEYQLDGENCDFSGFNGLYVWLEGFSGSLKHVNLFYCANKAWVNIGNTYGGGKGSKPQFFALNNSVDVWHKVQIDIKKDYERSRNNQLFDTLNLDRLVLSAGIWNVNTGRTQPFAAYLRGFDLQYNTNSGSKINDQEIAIFPEKDKWWRGKNMPSGNVAGEHHYFIEGREDLKY
ncbi:metallophosphoesterase [uncultured Draconibacterium sp.]|uniref:metallophosphoesterase family protein n=1 Tax=uncultured Draconibacterium sp. TaxID=1573823 RepID=UPI0029C6D242|nr:metallophosphoesterase [uncultured Draconibacterium sp.]